MRHLLLLGLVLASAPAFAEPSSYMRGGVEAGANDGYLTAGGLLEVGTQVVPGVMVHAVATHGGAEVLFSSGSGRYTQVRAGFDLIGCHRTATICSFAGVDFGVQHTYWSGIEGSLFDSNTDNQMMTSRSSLRPIGVGRVGLDIGGAHLRWRPSLELAFSDQGANGANVMQSLAYRF